MTYETQTTASGATVNLFSLPEVIQPFGVPVMTPILTFSNPGGDTYRIDARASEYDNGSGVSNATGGTIGNHYYTFTGQKQSLDIGAGSALATLVAGSNVQAVPGGFEKTSSAGWDASVASSENFDPSVQDFAVTVYVENITGSINEMVGLATRAMANQSYNTIDFAVYCVNSYFYSRVYESGAATIIPGYITNYFSVGDRVGVKVVDGVVTYFVVSAAGVIKDIYTSLKTAEAPLFFRAALHRGPENASGAATVTDIQFHTATSPTSLTVQIGGQATAEISDSDKTELKRLGMFVNAGATYSDLHFDRPASVRFPAGSTIDCTHIYSVNNAQGLETLTF